MAWLFEVLICGHNLSHQVTFPSFNTVPYPCIQEQRTIEYWQLNLMETLPGLKKKWWNKPEEPVWTTPLPGEREQEDIKVNWKKKKKKKGFVGRVGGRESTVEQ